MTHFAVLCPEAAGHLHPMTALLAELQQRGHRITWISTLDGQQRLHQLGIDTRTIAETAFPLGTLDELLAEVGRLSGFAAARCTLMYYRQAMQVLMEEAPQAIRATGATMLIADESIFAARTIAELCELPWVTVCNALPMHPDPNHPPLLPAWPYREGLWARVRNRLGHSLAQTFMWPMARDIRAFRRRHGLPAYDLVHGNASHLATMAQIPREFDYPRREKPDWFHYVGALHDRRTRPHIDFPYARLDGRPLVYASLGTVQNRLLPLFATIAAACEPLDVQLVISLGGGAKAEQLGTLPGQPIVVDYAPQLELIERATLVITHAGMNTTMEALTAGVPLVALPVTNDQPAVARRIEWSGCGRRVPLRKAREKNLERAICDVLEDPCHRAAAQSMARANQQAGGIQRAAALIEQAVSTPHAPRAIAQ